MTAAPPPWPTAAYAGSLLGVCGWVLGLAGLCLAHARFDLLLTMVLPALCLSLALGLLLLLAHRLARNVGGVASRLVLVGGMLTVLGTLLLVAGEWVLPVLLSDRGMRASLTAMNSVLSVPIGVPAAVLAVGAACLGVAALRLEHRAR